MSKTKVVFLGSRPMGSAALSRLSFMNDVEIVGCVTKAPPRNAWWSDDPHGNHDYPNISHEELGDVDFDFGISINYWKIIEPQIISRPSLGFVNLHHSYMLSLRGRDMTSHAIINARRTGRWYHGTTLHYTDDGLDTGPIIATDSCPILESDTAWSLFQRVEAIGKNMLDLWLPRLVAGRPPVSYPEPEQPLNMRKDATKKEIADLNADPLLIYDVVRAYDFNGHFEPASTLIDGAKVYLTTTAREGYLVLDAGGGRRVYRADYKPAA